MELILVPYAKNKFHGSVESIPWVRGIIPWTRGIISMGPWNVYCYPQVIEDKLKEEGRREGAAMATRAAAAASPASEAPDVHMTH